MAARSKQQTAAGGGGGGGGGVVTPQTSADWAGILDGLAADLANIAAAVAELEAERDGLPLAATLGDAAAAARLRELDTRRQDLRHELARLEDARTAAVARHEAAVAAEQAVAEAARREALREVARAQVKMAARVDAAARKLAEALRAFDNGLVVMMQHGLDAGAHRRLSARAGTMRAAALHAAGLTGMVPLSTVQQSHRMTWERYAAQALSSVTGDAPPPAANAGLDFEAARQSGQEAIAQRLQDEAEAAERARLAANPPIIYQGGI